LDCKDPVEELREVGRITFVDTPLDAAALNRAMLPANTSDMEYFDFAGARRAILDVTKAAA
jgi:hypothetical protein